MQCYISETQVQIREKQDGGGNQCISITCLFLDPISETFSKPPFLHAKAMLIGPYLFEEIFN